jgi:hypothetical protein
MKKRFLFLLPAAAALIAVTAFAQSGISNPVYKPHARFVIPVQPQPEFTGTQTNVLSFTAWETNGTAHVYSSTNIVSVVNTNTFAFCDFELFAIDQTNPTNPVFYASSISTAEWENYPELKALDWSTLELE